MPNSGMNVLTSRSDEWETPDWLFRALDTEFGFTLDPCATKENAKCATFITKEQDGLQTKWGHAHRAFINPPYSEIQEWVVAALQQTCDLTVLLLPVRTDTRWFRMLIELPDVRIRYLRKRIRFLEAGVEQSSPRFASLIAIL